MVCGQPLKSSKQSAPGMRDIKVKQENDWNLNHGLQQAKELSGQEKTVHYPLGHLTPQSNTFNFYQFIYHCSSFLSPPSTSANYKHHRHSTDVCAVISFPGKGVHHQPSDPCTMVCLTLHAWLPHFQRLNQFHLTRSCAGN